MVKVCHIQRIGRILHQIILQLLLTGKICGSRLPFSVIFKDWSNWILFQNLAKTLGCVCLHLVLEGLLREDVTSKTCCRACFFTVFCLFLQRHHFVEHFLSFAMWFFTNSLYLFLINDHLIYFQLVALWLLCSGHCKSLCPWILVVGQFCSCFLPCLACEYSHAPTETIFVMHLCKGFYPQLHPTAVRLVPPNL